VANTRNEIAERDQPAAEPAKPRLRAIDRWLMPVKMSVQDGHIDDPADCVAHGNTGQAPRNRGERGRCAAHQSFPDQSAGHREQQLIGDRHADDSKYLSEEQQRGAVPNQPRDELAFHYRNLRCTIDAVAMV